MMISVDKEGTMFTGKNKSLISLELILMTIWALFLAFFTYVANGRKIGIDDADIFFTYANNMAKGIGLVYSVGIPKVEGYTSALWMFSSFLIFKVGLSEIGIWLFSLLLFVLTNCISFRIIEISVKKSSWMRAKIFYIFAISLSFSYTSWILNSLMDTALWGFLLIASGYVLISSTKQKSKLVFGCLIFALIPLTRPEAILIFPLIFVCVAFFDFNWITENFLPIISLFIFSTITVIAFRYLYFGYPLPNTYYAKVSDSVGSNLYSGSLYVGKFLNTSLIGLTALCISVSQIAFLVHQQITRKTPNQRQENQATERRSLTILSLFILIYVLVTAISGGDHFNLFRFMQPIYPFMVLIIVLCGFRIMSNFQSISSSLLTMFMILFFIFSDFLSTVNDTSWGSTAVSGRSPIAHEFEIAEDGRRLGIELNEMFIENDLTPSVGTITAGGLARTYQGTIFDLMGLNNEEMAHSSKNRKGYKDHAVFDKEIFFNWSVDVVLSSPDSWGMQVALKELDRDLQFKNEYRYGCIVNLQSGNLRICAFFRNEFLSQVDDSSSISFVGQG